MHSLDEEMQTTFREGFAIILSVFQKALFASGGLKKSLINGNFDFCFGDFCAFYILFLRVHKRLYCLSFSVRQNVQDFNLRGGI